MPRGYVVGEAGDCLEFICFKRGAGDLRFGGELGGVEEATEWDGDLLGQNEAEFSGELVLVGDPDLVSGWAKIENRVAADWGRGKAGDEGQQRLPLESGEGGVFDRRRNGIEEGHVVQEL